MPSNPADTDAWLCAGDMHSVSGQGLLRHAEQMILRDVAGNQEATSRYAAEFADDFLV